MNRHALITVITLAVLATWATGAAATLVAPHALFIDHRVRSAAIFLHNPDDKPVEIGVELVYGYPRGNGQGGVEVFLEPNPAAGEPSCAEWVRALPRRVILMPGQRQTVRLLAKPPAGLPDGEYWSRVIISSRAVAREPEGEEIEGASGVRVGLKLATRTIISLNYRKGPVTTGLELGRLEAELARDAVTISMELARQGDAAWLGRIDAVLLDFDGNEVSRWDKALAVYEDQSRTVRFPLESAPGPGSYTLSVTWSTEREDLDPAQTIPATTIARSLSLVPVGSRGR